MAGTFSDAQVANATHGMSPLRASATRARVLAVRVVNIQEAHRGKTFVTFAS